MTFAIGWFMALASTAPAPENAALPYAAWDGARHPAPSAIVLDAAPPPVPEEPEQARRLWEFVPDFAVALPSCRGSAAGCGGIRPGIEVGFTGLYRPVPYFAFGASARLDVFSLGGTPSVQASTTFFGLTGRLYPFESGFFDPYLELSLGVGSLESAGTAARRREGTHVDLAPGARAAGGLDFAVSSWLRLGPTFAISEYAARTATYCTPEGCASRSATLAALPRGATTFGFRLTVSMGERL